MVWSKYHPAIPVCHLFEGPIRGNYTLITSWVAGDCSCGILKDQYIIYLSVYSSHTVTPFKIHLQPPSIHFLTPIVLFQGSERAGFYPSMHWVKDSLCKRSHFLLFFTYNEPFWDWCRCSKIFITDVTAAVIHGFMSKWNAGMKPYGITPRLCSILVFLSSLFQFCDLQVYRFSLPASNHRRSQLVKRMK